jgi:hypothetical protein
MVSLFFCPNMGSLNSVYKIKNGYGDLNERNSFSIDIDICDSTLRNDCLSDDKI